LDEIWTNFVKSSGQSGKPQKGSEMTDTACKSPNTQNPNPGSARHLAAREDAALREALKHCSRSTYYAAYQFRLTGDPDRLPTLVLGVIEHYVEADLHGRLGHPDSELLLCEHLGIDSLDLMEIVALLEDVLQIQVSDTERTAIRTLADLRRYLESKAPRHPRSAH
jgi:3-hydroxyacyl-[acyl-carrier-protein] dehydratase